MRLLPALVVLFAISCTSTREIASSSNPRVLLLGDSQSYRGFGLGLQARRFPNALDVVAQSGATASWYLDGRDGPWGLLVSKSGGVPERKFPAPTPRAEELLKEFRPALVVIQLGGNSSHDDVALTEKDARQLISKVRASGARCFWVGPPPGWARPAEKFAATVETLQRVATEEGACDGFLDSRFLQVPLSGGDGIHLDTYTNGAQLLSEWLDRAEDEIFDSPSPSAGVFRTR
jgi:hypothetical protein